MSATIENRKARHNYEFTEKLEAGLVLTGSEVKALRAGHASIAESYAGLPHGQRYSKNKTAKGKASASGDSLFLLNAHIGVYEPAGAKAHALRRPRRLLLNKKEQTRLAATLREGGTTLIPLRIYFNEKGIAKMELGLGRGRKKYEHRERDKARDWQKRKERLLRHEK